MPRNRLHTLAAVLLALVCAVAWAGAAAAARQGSEGSDGGLTWRRAYTDEGRLQTAWQVRTGPDGAPVRHGWFIRYHRNGRRAVTGQYSQGTSSGRWSWFSEDGRLVRRAIRRGEEEKVLEGRRLTEPTTVFMNPAGVRVAEGRLKYDQGHGLWRYYYPDGRPRAEGEFATGIPNGRWAYYHPNGQLERVRTYEFGVPHGPYMEGYPNGQERAEGRLAHGVREGPWRTWHRNGRLAGQGRYQAGERHGEWRFWDERGELTRHVRYRAGEVVETLPLPEPPPGPPQIVPEDRQRDTRRPLVTDPDGNRVPFTGR